MTEYVIQVRRSEDGTWHDYLEKRMSYGEAIEVINQARLTAAKRGWNATYRVVAITVAVLNV